MVRRAPLLAHLVVALLPRQILGIPFAPPVAAPAAMLPAISLGTPNARGVRTFVDAHGHERHFHGVNAVVKGPPWHPTVGAYDFETSLVDRDFELLQSAGVNVLRLGVMWSGVEPVRGQYNSTYMETIRGIAQAAATYGIYTLLDMHQDAMSERFCGEGFPPWAVQPSGHLPFPEPVAAPFADPGPGGLPSRSDCARHAWFHYYFSEASATAWQALYSNKDGLLDAWGAMWGTVAAAFKGEPHILGIEAINEPFAGDVIHDPLLLRPMHASSANLQHVFDVLAQQVWAADPARLFFFAGVPWANLGTGFAHAPAGSDNGYRSVLVFHHYEVPYGPQLTNSSREHAQLYVEDAKRLGTGLMLTEFAELCGTSSADSQRWEAETSAADGFALSWISWEYKSFSKGAPSPTPDSQWNEFGARKTGVGGCLFDPDGAVRVRNLRAQARPYAQFVAGRLRTLEFEPLVARLYLAIEPQTDANLTHTSVIYVGLEHWYPDGYHVDVQPTGAAVWGPMGANFLGVRVLETPETETQAGETGSRKERGEGGGQGHSQPEVLEITVTPLKKGVSGKGSVGTTEGVYSKQKAVSEVDAGRDRAR
jgi:endoglycosylceramidase